MTFLSGNIFKIIFFNSCYQSSLLNDERGNNIVLGELEHSKNHQDISYCTLIIVEEVVKAMREAQGQSNRTWQNSGRISEVGGKSGIGVANWTD